MTNELRVRESPLRLCGVKKLLVPARRTKGWGFVAAIALCAACGGGVGDEHQEQKPPVEDGPSHEPPPAKICTTARESFAREVWAGVLNQHCVQCHAPGGVAAEQNASLRLLPATYPGFLDKNYENLALVAKFSFDGMPVLLQKPIGSMGHGGGAPLQKKSPEYKALERFIASVSDEDACEVPMTAPAEVVMLDPDATFRKAALQLADRLPSAEEREQLAARGEAALVPLLEDLMEEDAFIERVMELYNDQLLTERYLPANAAVTLLNLQEYPGATAAFAALDVAARERANIGVAREPLLLIAHVVRNDLPFSQILTADYTVVNSGSATLYGVEAEFDDPSDAHSLQMAQVTLQRGTEMLEIPHAGLLTTPAFLNRFPTTPTNRNRHRARKVYEFFLATDILKAADRPIDPLAAARLNNPTRDDSQCNACHRQLDPIAGAFMKWNEVDQDRFEPEGPWHQEMFAPGFGDEVMETSDFETALPWLAERIVADPRFVLATIHTVFRAITGQEPLAYPRDTQADDYDARLSAWVNQDALFERVGQRFVEDEMRFKTLVRELVLSPEFRADNAEHEIAALDLPRFAAMGSGRLSTPERLAAKVEAVTGLPWSASATSQPYLLQEYKTLYGGIDSDAVVQRLSQPNGIMTGVAARMANEVSCRVTAWDFSRGKNDRVLFPGVERDDVPEADGAPVEDSVERIRAALVQLHDRVLGERLQPDDREIDRSFELFVETWRESAEAEPAGTGDVSLPAACHALTDPTTGAALAEDARIVSDPNHTIRAWMAVMTFLLSDYDFLYER
jgi:hypothetical protein